MANNIAAAIGEKYERQLQHELYESYVGAFIANTKVDDAFNGNDTVHFPRFNKLTVADLATSYTTFTPEDVVLTDETMTLDKRKVGAYQISDEDYVEMGVNPDAELIKSMKDAFANSYDTEILSEYANAGVSVTDADMSTATNGGGVNSVTLSETNVHDLLTAVNEKMDIGNVPANDRWIVVSPAEKRLLSRFVGARDTSLGDKIVSGGFMGELDGLKIFYSNNLQTVTTVKHLLAGQGKPICFASNIKPTVTFVSSKTQTNSFINTFKAQTKFGVHTFHEGAIKLFDVEVTA
tara:strand:+ start:291 stop:1169 length:879 start_codon:yes stop_codon:yes gene_type:complete